MSPLRRRMIEDMQIRNLATHTQRVYVEQVARFARYFHKSPDLLGPTEIRTYLIHLTQDRRLAASSIILVVSALRFFYTVTLRRPWVVEDDIPTGRQAKKLPVVCIYSRPDSVDRSGLHPERMTGIPANAALNASSAVRPCSVPVAITLAAAA
jgi:hypothetical protein